MSRSPTGPSTAVLAVDTGGTFTDLVLVREGRIHVLKVPSTPADPSEAILEGSRELLAAAGGGDDEEVFLLFHGSTVATNAILERKGARVALVTNRGFEDVLAIGRQNRPQLYALTGHRKPPLVPRERRLGVAGRLDPRGKELEPVDPRELEELADRLGSAEAVAVCLLHAYADPAHEEAVAGALAGAGLPVSVSSRILPEYREFERTSTTVMNAYVTPVMSRYLGRLARESGAERVAVMGSNGGMLAVERAAREPVHTVLSGPAGGVMGALAWARTVGVENVLTFDMGGTSTDVSLCPGRPLHTREYDMDGQPVAIPVMDIHTVGAGGGSLARVDAGGALRVGPESAGADPGPVCYGRGGTGITVTDAHVWLGRLPAEGFLGGNSALDREAVEAPLDALARELGMSPEAAAEGVLEVADTAMERALRVISVERGFDPRDFSLVAFGGAGGLHAAELARRLGVREALIPPDPGLLSAYGILTSPPTREATRTLLLATAPGSDGGGRASGSGPEGSPPAGDGPGSGVVPHEELDRRVREALDELQETAARRLEAEDGIARDDMTVHRWVEARYQGQSFELRVPAEDWLEGFHAAHQQRYGYRRDTAAVEVVTVRAVVSGPGIQARPPRLPEASEPPQATSGRAVVDGRWIEAPRFWRTELEAGHRMDGPAVIQDYSSTTWLPPEWHATVHPSGVLRLRRDRD